MATAERRSTQTHEVFNQPPPLEDYNPATSPVLAEALIREGGEWGADEVFELGALSIASAAVRARRASGARTQTQTEQGPTTWPR